MDVIVTLPGRLGGLPARVGQGVINDAPACHASGALPEFLKLLDGGWRDRGEEVDEVAVGVTEQD